MLASIVPLNATLPSAIGGGAALLVETTYPFGDLAAVHVSVPAGHSTTAYIRIPGWAVNATVDGKAAPNGTLVAVVCAAGETSVAVHLPASVRVERGWGVHGEAAQSPIVYNKVSVSAPRVVPSSNQSDWELDGGAAFVGSRNATSGGTDIRSGNPGGSVWLVNTHPVYGEAHNITQLKMAFSYIAGYSPAPGAHKEGSVASLHFLDMVTRADLTGALVSFPPLSKYSYDHFTGYSPPLGAALTNLSFPNAKPFLVRRRPSNPRPCLKLAGLLLAGLVLAGLLAAC